jgi:hypothetical protein
MTTKTCAQHTHQEVYMLIAGLQRLSSLTVIESIFSGHPGQSSHLAIETRPIVGLGYGALPYCQPTFDSLTPAAEQLARLVFDCCIVFGLFWQVFCCTNTG